MLLYVMRIINRCIINLILEIVNCNYLNCVNCDFSQVVNNQKNNLSDDSHVTNAICYSHDAR